MRVVSIIDTIKDDEVIVSIEESLRVQVLVVVIKNFDSNSLTSTMR